MSRFSTPPALTDSALLRLPPINSENSTEANLPGRDTLFSVERRTSHQIAHYLSSFGLREFDHNGRPPGFSILSRRLIARHHTSRYYPDPLELPEAQQQPYGNCGSVEFDKALCAMVGPCLIGIVYCEWMLFKRDETFWGYNLSFVDVHASWRENGIASALIKRLNIEPWLAGKNLCLTSYTGLGQERIAHVVTRELTSTNYTLKQPWY